MASRSHTETHVFQVQLQQPPDERNQVTDAARAKSYRTACAIVAKTVETSELTEAAASS